jgi:hypothetical protein
MVLPVVPDSYDDTQPAGAAARASEPEDDPGVQSRARRDGSRRPFLSRLAPIFWQGKLGPAFWTVASVVSLAVNIFLIVLLILAARQLFSLKTVLSGQLVDGLYQNFASMDRAHIITTISVKDTIPVVFDLPVKTETKVVLTRDTRIRDASVNLSTGGLSITNAPANIVLPAGTELPISLSIMVPVSTTVPVNLTVPVDIPLDQTELHQPFVGLQNVVNPYRKLLAGLPDSWIEIPFCNADWTWVVCDTLLIGQ